MKSTTNSLKLDAGIYRMGSSWTLEFPAPCGVTEHPTLKAAVEAARKAGLAPKRWYGCDAEVAS
jgi:hypothetical protein